MEIAQSTGARAFNAHRHGLTGHILIRTPSEQAAASTSRSPPSAPSKPPSPNPSPTTAAASTAPTPRWRLHRPDDRCASTAPTTAWRLHRPDALESDIFALFMSDADEVSTGSPDSDDAMAQARAWLSRGKSLDLLGLYENRLTRHLEKSMAELRRLQAQRQAAVQQALEEAELLAPLAESQAKLSTPSPLTLPPRFCKN